MANSPWYKLLEDTVAIPFLEGISQFFTAAVAVAFLALFSWAHRQYLHR